MFTRPLYSNNKYSRVLTYFNIRVLKLYFLLIKDIFNYRNINLISFFNCSIICFIINIYSDDQQFILEYLKDTKVNLNNILIMTENFNIRNNNWNPSYSHRSTHVNTLREITDSFNLKLLMLIDQVPT